MKVLLLDIEISPTQAVVWGLFNQTLSPDHIVGNSEVLCWSAKWLDGDATFFCSVQITSKRKMLRQIYKLLEEADTVVTYNGNAFDLKILNKEFLLQGWGPPVPYKSVDLLQVMRKRFRFTSNKLGYVTEMLKIGSKVKHAGLQLWLDCMNPRSVDYADSWKLMEKYNIQDVHLLESHYKRILGWIPSHPNYSAMNGKLCCPNCASTFVQKRGTVFTASSLYARFVCKSCGKWSRSRITERKPSKEQLVGIS